MGFYGSVVIYSVSLSVDLKTCLDLSLRIGAPTKAEFVTAFKPPIRKGGKPQIIFKRPTATPAELSALISHDYTLKFEIDNAPWREWQAAFTQEIPEPIRGEFRPCAIRLILGPHPIEELTEFEDARVIARTSFSFKIWGWGSPNDWVEYRRLAPEVSVVKQVRAEFAAIGIDTAVYCTWND